MAFIAQSVVSKYNKYVEETADPRVQNMLFMSSPIYMIVVIVLYNYFIRKLGPAWMKNREPFNADILMIIHNITQILLNGWFCFMTFKLIWIPAKYNLICENLDTSDDPTSAAITFYVWLFFMIKILDMLDTVFMVLRKRGQQMTFLHVYHHSGMVFAAWVCTRYIPGGHPMLFGTVNALVHIVMYSYYLFTTLYPEYKKNIWWKRYVTEMQMWQFVITAVHACLALFNTTCNVPKGLLLFFVPQDIFMLLLFWEFYNKAYRKEKRGKFNCNSNEIDKSTYVNSK